MDWGQSLQLLYCDESNLEERAGDFLLYAGVTVPAEQARSLSDTIANLRAGCGIPADASVKFAPAPNPFEHTVYRDFKQRVIEAAIEHECKLLAYVVLHDLARDPDQARRFGVNTLCWHFQCVLNRADDVGLVLIDRFNDEGNEIDGLLREKMSGGVDIPHRGPVELNRIVGFHYSAIGQSHFTSLIDILVGSLRWAMNVHCRHQEHREQAVNLLQILSPLFWRSRDGSVPDIGICFSPLGIRSERYFDLYRSLQNFICEVGIQSSQEIKFTG